MDNLQGKRRASAAARLCPWCPGCCGDGLPRTHVAVDRQLGGDKQVLLLVCIHGAQDAVETAFLGHSLGMHLKLAVSGLQPLGRHSNEFNFSRESIPMLSCAPVVLDRLLGSALVAPTCTTPFQHGWARPAPSRRG